MYKLISLGLVSLDMIGTLKIVGFAVGIPLIIIWLATVKNTTALFYDKKKMRATFIFGIPGLILLVTGIVLMITAAPIRSNIWVANYTAKDGRIEIDGSTYNIPSGSWLQIDVRTEAERYTAKGFVGDSAVFDTTMTLGSYIGNLGGDKVVIAEEIKYSSYKTGLDDENLAYEMLMAPGIAQFSESLIDDPYDFDEDAPESLSVDANATGSIHKYDLRFMSTAELFDQFLEAMGEEGGDVDSLLNSLEDSVGSEEIEADSLDID